MGIAIKCDKCKEVFDNQDPEYWIMEKVSWWKGADKERYLCEECEKELDKILINWLQSKGQNEERNIKK